MYAIVEIGGQQLKVQKQAKMFVNLMDSAEGSVVSFDKVLLIEIFEKNGGRHQTLQVENSDLIKARLINDMHLKF